MSPEPSSLRTGYGNVGLFATLGNRVDLRGLPGGGRSPAKPVSGPQKSLLAGKVQGIFCLLSRFGRTRLR